MIEAIKPAWLIAKREVRDQFRDWRIIFPIVGLTVFFPFLMNFTAQQILSFVRDYGATLVGERMVPFLLMIVAFFPLSSSLVIALESFVGEKERGSIEPLLNTPLKDWQIYLGKLVSSTVPPLLGSYLGMAVYLTSLALNHVPLPETPILILIIVLTTVQAVMMVSGAVVVSTQATSVRASNLLASFIVIPSALLIQGEAIVMFWGHTIHVLWWAVFGLAVISILLVRVGLAHFQREELLGREIDVLNFRWMLRVFVQAFVDGAHSPWEWITRSLPRAVVQLRLPLLITALLAVAGLVIGASEIREFNARLPVTNMGELNSRFKDLLGELPMFSAAPVVGIWWQNVRVLLLAMLLGAVSMGILGVLPLILSLGVVGYILALIGNSGLPVWQFALLILPHGIIEIPASILGTAAVLHAGAILATPNPDKTIGEVWLITLGNWAKVMVGLVIPMLLIAACIEAWITPRLALYILR